MVAIVNIFVLDRSRLTVTTIVKTNEIQSNSHFTFLESFSSPLQPPHQPFLLFKVICLQDRCGANDQAQRVHVHWCFSNAHRNQSRSSMTCNGRMTQCSLNVRGEFGSCNSTEAAITNNLLVIAFVTLLFSLLALLRFRQSNECRLRRADDLFRLLQMCTRPQWRAWCRRD